MTVTVYLEESSLGNKMLPIINPLGLNESFKFSAIIIFVALELKKINRHFNLYIVINLIENSAILGILSRE